MSNFSINNSQTIALREKERGFGATQAMVLKQQEKDDAKKAEEEKKYALQDDTVTISDEAKLIINSQLGKLQDSENPDSMFMSATDAAQLVKSVGKAQDEMDEANGVEDEDAMTATKEQGADGAGSTEGTAHDIVTGDEEGQDPLDAQIEALQEQVEEKQKEIQKLMKDNNPEAQKQVAMLQMEVQMLTEQLVELQETQKELAEG